MNKKIILTTLLIGFGLGVLSFLLLSNVNSTLFSFDPIPQNIKGIKIKSNLIFAGELIPTDNPDVAERLERELLINTYQHSATILHLKLATRYLPTVERIFKEEGLPDDLKYIAVAESSLRNAVSSAGAKGIWQFKEAAAGEMGLVINDYVDERNNFEKSTYAAAKYLKRLNEKFNSWALACAAYNMGAQALITSMKEQGEESYFNLNLSDETNRYLFRIIAIKEIMNHPDHFGYYLEPTESYESLTNYKTIEVDSSINNLSQFAHGFGITYRELKIHNPWLLKSTLVNKNKELYKIKIPAK